MNAGNTICLVSLLALALTTSHVAQSAEPTDREKIRAADQAVEKLREKTRLDVIETPFSDVVKDLANNLGITIILDPEGLDESSVTPDQLVTLNLQDKRADAIFRVLLEPLHLDCGVRDGLLVITSREKYEQGFLSLRVFDIRELLEQAGTPSKPLPRWERPGAMGGGFFAVPDAPAPAGAGGGSAPQAAPAPPQPTFEPQTPADHFVAMVCDAIAPHSWIHRGGTATAKVYGGMLVVRQTEEALAEIDDLVEQMRRVSTGGDDASK